MCVSPSAVLDMNGNSLKLIGLAVQRAYLVCVVFRSSSFESQDKKTVDVNRKIPALKVKISRLQI